MNVKKFIKSLPYPIEQSTRYIYSLLPPRVRYGKTFWSTYNLLKESQYWSLERIENYQMAELNRLLNYAYENVPYYKRIFKERDIKPDDIRSFKDLERIPFLTKEIIRKNTKELISKEYPLEKLKFVTTGGSTGNPLGFYADEKTYFEREWAFMVSQWNRVGYRFGSKSVVLRGNIIKRKRRGIYQEYDPIFKNLYLSTYHMNEETLTEYIRIINEFKPEFIWNYPSALTILAKFMENNNIKPLESVKALLCGSENLYPLQRELFEKVFKCRVYSWYGHTEQAVLAGECENSKYYHIFPEYGFVELINNGKVINNDNELGEIVATGFNNYVFPFIRYRTLDIAKYKNGSCSCGRNYKLFEKVEGRTQDLIVTRDGRLITLTALIFAQHFESFSKLKEMQIVQEKKGELIIKIVKNPGFSDFDKKEIAERIHNAVGDGLKIKFEFVSNITRTKSGKMRFLIQKIPFDFNDFNI
jgi:phenylacetate-CoA ligase